MNTKEEFTFIVGNSFQEIKTNDMEPEEILEAIICMEQQSASEYAPRGIKLTKSKLLSHRTVTLVKGEKKPRREIVMT